MKMWDIIQMRDNMDGTVSLHGSDGTVETMPFKKAIVKGDSTRKVALDKTAADIQKQTDVILKARRVLGKPFGALDMTILEGTRIMTDSLPNHLKTRRYPPKLTIPDKFKFHKKKTAEYAADDPRAQVSTTGDLFKYKETSSIRRAKK
jgi:hypothetical protein